LPEDLYLFREQPGQYLAFLGRIAPEKRVDRAIEVAKRVGMPIKIAAKVDRVDQLYFERIISPLLAHPLVEYVGELGQREKDEFLGNAYALLFPIDWPEPFGLVMIEAMACGTPVVAYRRGSVPEVLGDGSAGFVVEGLNDAAAAVKKIGAISRQRCREVFEERFSVRRMAEEYVAIYRRLLQPRMVPRAA
jgi:glycosyltransferase involved in cell wall biosynthesis